LNIISDASYSSSFSPTFFAHVFRPMNPSHAVPVSGIAAKTTLASFEGRLSGGTGANNSYLFNTKGSGPGVWTGIGTTKTKASSTLFVTK
jgi:hypothetical protein